MIEARHLTVGYSSRSRNNPVLCDVSLTVPQGAVCAVIGPSGCGKSTLLKVIAGLIHPDQGSVLLDGSPVNPKNEKSVLCRRIMAFCHGRRSGRISFWAVG